MSKKLMMSSLLAGSLLLAGCATTGVSRVASDEDVNPGALGHPFRVVAFVVHPVGVIVDYTVFRPAYWFVSLAPGLFGYTAQDDAEFSRHVGR